MTELKKTVYMSNDDKTFDTKEECLEYERKVLGDLICIRSMIAAHTESLRRDIQFIKSKCGSCRCLGYALKMRNAAKAKYVSALRKKKIKLEDAKELQKALSTYISAVETYNETVAAFNDKKKTLREYVYLGSIAGKCDTTEELKRKMDMILSYAARRHACEHLMIGK